MSNTSDSSLASDWLGLTNKVVAVTGACGGLGRAITNAFLEQGCRVAALDTDAQRVAATTEAIATNADTVLGVVCDVTNADAVNAAADTVASKFGKCDILVNNAGILHPGSLDNIEHHAWREMLAVNLDGYLLCAQAFAKQMRDLGSGALIHVASIAASHPQPHSGAYSAGKAAVSMLSRQMAAEWGSVNIRSNCISPGLVVTPMSEAFYADPKIRKAREQLVPAHRIGTPEDIANATVFLASPRASYINGQEILIDGGLAQTLMGNVPRPGFGD